MKHWVHWGAAGELGKPQGLGQRVGKLWGIGQEEKKCWGSCGGLGGDAPCEPLGRGGQGEAMKVGDGGTKLFWRSKAEVFQMAVILAELNLAQFGSPRI